MSLAIVYHKGVSGAGHFQAGLQNFWMRTDDEVTAVLHPGLPHGESRGTAQIWLIRQDRHQFSDMMPPPPYAFQQQVRLIQTKMREDPTDLWKHQHLLRLLRCLCIYCGQWVFTLDDHVHHMRERRPDVPLPWDDYERETSRLVHNPCRWCKAWNTEQHPCQVLWQASLAKHLDPQSMPDVTLTLDDLAVAAQTKKADAATLPKAPAMASSKAPLPLEETLAALATPLPTRATSEDSFWRFLETANGPAPLASYMAQSDASDDMSDAPETGVL